MLYTHIYVLHQHSGIKNQKALKSNVVKILVKFVALFYPTYIHSSINSLMELFLSTGSTNLCPQKFRMKKNKRGSKRLQLPFLGADE